jgi:Tol biopolymer transport system component
MADTTRRAIVPQPLPAPVRYPAVSPDGRWLAFSEEDTGAWQLGIMNLATGEEHRLTNGDCNSVTPAWYADSETLVYAMDCGRGLGLTALFRILAVP